MKFEDLIGSTPLYPWEKNLFLKLEYTNLTGSVKDRAALEMILDGEKRGYLKPGSTIIEPTSGNTGISLAAIAAQRGYDCIIVMPDTMSPERRQMMAAYGANILLTPGGLGMAGAVQKAKEMAQQQHHCWIPDQFANPANAQAHYRTTGPEIWNQTEGKIDILVAGVGTGGTITGTGRFLKEKNPMVRVAAVEPAGSPLLKSGRWGSHGIQGIGANFIPEVLDRSLLDEIISVTDEEAFAGARTLAKRGILAGISSGAAYHGAQIAAKAYPNQNVVAILPDSGSRYLSTGLYYDAQTGKV